MSALVASASWSSFDGQCKEFRACSRSFCRDAPNQLRINLFIGSRDSESSYAALSAAGITHILQAGVELSPTHPARFTYTQTKVVDTEEQDLVQAFEEAFTFIDEGRKHGAVLVHCAQGVSRSVSLLTGYLMTREGLTYEAALAELQAVRPQAQPNPGFALQLQEFGRLGSDPSSWPGWSKGRAAACFEATSVSKRREVCGLAETIRRFHQADVGEEDTVFDMRAFLL